MIPRQPRLIPSRGQFFFYPKQLKFVYVNHSSAIMNNVNGNQLEIRKWLMQSVVVLVQVPDVPREKQRRWSGCRMVALSRFGN
nr:MAG TPA: Neuromedin U [Inoviridae sp.]